MRFAFGGKFGKPERPPAAAFFGTGVPAESMRGNRPARAAAPNPRAVFAKKCRRVRAKASVKRELAESIPDTNQIDAQVHKVKMLSGRHHLLARRTRESLIDA